MVKPVFFGWYFRCPICGCMALEDDRACLRCGEPFDWGNSEAEEGEL